MRTEISRNILFVNLIKILADKFHQKFLSNLETRDVDVINKCINS